MIKIDPNFWSTVEDSSKLKYVVYGDSIAEDEPVLVGLKFNNYEIELIPFNKLWNILCDNFSLPFIKDGKEYIFVNDKLKVMTYFEDSDTFELKSPLYLMRHKISKPICKLNFENNNSLKLTHDHSLLEYNSDTNKLVSISPTNAKSIIIANQYLDKYRKKKIPSKQNISTVIIKSKEDVEYEGYVYDFSILETQNFVVNGFLVHNTDSLYVNVPSVKYEDAKDANEQVTKISSEINDVINDVLENSLFPKFRIDKKYNRTNFKIESVISMALFLDIKKNYAYKEIAKKGKIYDKPEVQYTGIPVVRSDYSKLAQDFIRTLIEDIAFDESDSDLLEALSNLAREKHEKIVQCVEELDLKYIATPGKWKSNYKNEPFTVIGMRLYNTIMDSEIFRQGTDGMSLPIKFKDIHKFLESIKDIKNRSDVFLNNINIDKINYIVVPSNYEPEVLRSKMNEYGISIDIETLWDKSYSKIAKDIVNVIKSSAK